MITAAQLQELRDYHTANAKATVYIMLLLMVPSDKAMMEMMDALKDMSHKACGVDAILDALEPAASLQ